jgi:hypothetical protein
MQDEGKRLGLYDWANTSWHPLYAIIEGERWEVRYKNGGKSGI